MVGIISVVIGDHFGGGDHFDGGDHFGGGTRGSERRQFQGKGVGDCFLRSIFWGL